MVTSGDTDHQGPMRSTVISCSVTFKVEVGAFGVLMTQAVVLETAADWQLLDLTGDSVSDVVVFTAALPLPLFTQTAVM